MVSVATSLKIKLPIDQADNPSHVPTLDEKLTRVIPAGRVSLTDTFAAVEGPKFLTHTVYVRFCPNVAVPGSAAIETDKSAPALTVTVKEQEEWFPHASIAFHVTVVIPELNETPFKVIKALPEVAPLNDAVSVKLLHASVAEASHEPLEWR